MRTFNKQVSTAQAMNVNSSSPYTQLRNIYTYCMAALITGSATGTIKLQASNDPETNDTQTNQATVLGQPPTNPPSKAPTHWADITGSSFVVTGTDTEIMWNVDAVGYNYVRVVYTDTSGGTSTATMNIVFNGKGV